MNFCFSQYSNTSTNTSKTNASKTNTSQYLIVPKQSIPIPPIPQYHQYQCRQYFQYHQYQCHQYSQYYQYQCHQHSQYHQYQYYQYTNTYQRRQYQFPRVLVLRHAYARAYRLIRPLSQVETTDSSTFFGTTQNLKSWERREGWIFYLYWHSKTQTLIDRTSHSTTAAVDQSTVDWFQSLVPYWEKTGTPERHFRKQKQLAELDVWSTTDKHINCDRERKLTASTKGDKSTTCRRRV